MTAALFALADSGGSDPSVARSSVPSTRSRAPPTSSAARRWARWPTASRICWSPSRDGRLEVTPGALEEVHAAVDLSKRMLDPAAEPTLDFTRAADEVRERLCASAGRGAGAGCGPGGRGARAPGPGGTRAARSGGGGRLGRHRGAGGAVGELHAAGPRADPRRTANDPRRARSSRRADGSRRRAGDRAQRARAPARRDRPAGRRPLREPGAAGAGGGRRRAPAARRAAARPGGRRGPLEDEHARPRSVAELFAELEFDRYDDLTLFARSVSEIASDIAEVHTELAALGRSVAGGRRPRPPADRRGAGRTRPRAAGADRHALTRASCGRARRRPGRRARACGSRPAARRVELDASVIEQIVDPLLHLVQNAVVHGIEAPDERQARRQAGGRRRHADRQSSRRVRGGGGRRRRAGDRRRSAAPARRRAGVRDLRGGDGDVRQRRARPDLPSRLQHGGRGHHHRRSGRGHGRRAHERRPSQRRDRGVDRAGRRDALLAAPAADRAGHRGAARARGGRGAGRAGQRGARDRHARSERASHHRGGRGGARSRTAGFPSSGSIARWGCPSRGRPSGCRCWPCAAVGACSRAWSTRSSTRKRSSSSRWGRFSTAWGRTRGRRSRPTGG